MRRFGNHLQMRLTFYIAALLLPIIIWCAVFSVIKEPKYNEKLTIAYFGTGCDITALGDELYRNLSNITDNDIKELNVNLASMEKNGLFTRLVEARLYSSDILIFSEKMWDDEMLKNNIIPISSDKLDLLKSRLPENTEYYTIDGYAYGIVIDGDEGTSNLSNHCNDTGRVLIIMSSESVNMSSLYGDGNPEDDSGIELLEYLLREVAQ